MKNYRYYDLILGAYVCVLLCANLIGPAKVSTVNVPLYRAQPPSSPAYCSFRSPTCSATSSPKSTATRATGVWCGAALRRWLFAAFMAAVIVRLPPADFWRNHQPAVEEIFGNTPRIICASIIAFWAARSSTATYWRR